MRGSAPRKASPSTNAAGRGSGPHCPHAAGPRPRSRRFFFVPSAGSVDPAHEPRGARARRWPAAPGPRRRRAALGRAGLGLPARPRGADRGRAGGAALHVNYGLRDSAGEDEALCRALCERLGVPLAVHRPRAPGGQPAGVGARPALRRGDAARARARRRRRRRPHRLRPGRDGALPARRLARPPRPARHARARRAARAPAARRLARGDRGVVRRGRAAVARGPLERVGRVRPQPRPPRARPRPARAAPGRRAERPAHARAAARRGRGARRRRHRRARGGRRAAVARAPARAPARARPPGRAAARRRGRRPRRLPPHRGDPRPRRARRPRRRRGLRARIERGRLEFVSTPARVHARGA